MLVLLALQQSTSNMIALRMALNKIGASDKETRDRPSRELKRPRAGLRESEEDRQIEIETNQRVGSRVDWITGV